MKVISFIIICVFSKKCSCYKNGSSSSDEDTGGSDNDYASEDNKSKIESKTKNQSHENKIHGSSGSWEPHQQKVLQEDNGSPWMIIKNGNFKTNFVNNYMGRILSSAEETSNLWEEKQKYSIRTNILSEPQSDNIFHDQIVNSFENLKELSAVMAKTYVDESSNSHHGDEGNTKQEDISNSPENSSRIDRKFKYKPAKLYKNDSIYNSYKLENTRKNKAFFDETTMAHLKSRYTRAEIKGNTTRSSENPRNVILKKYLMNALQSTASNSTIDVSNYEYQANRDTEESEGDIESEALEDYPYSASVQRMGSHYASGALVGERWILSTAVEFYNVRESIRLYRVRLGSVNCKKDGILTALKSITIHPKFVPGHSAMDVSVLRTAEPLLLSSIIKPIGISRVPVTSVKLVTTYWPRIVVKQGVMPSAAKERVMHSSMRVSTQKLVPTEKCRKMLAAVNVTLDKNSLCLQPVQIHHSDCMPDVGAPVVAVDGLWGITSGWVSPQCPAVRLPTIFTRVSTLALRTWINDQMQI